MTLRDAVVALIALLMTACSSPMKVVRLTEGPGTSLLQTRIVRTDVDLVELSDDEFEKVLIEQTRGVRGFSVPLVEARQSLLEPSRHEPYAHVRRHLGLVSPGSTPEAPLAHPLLELNPPTAALKHGYLRWCNRTWGDEDCLRLLVDRSTLDNDGKYTLAMAIAQHRVLGEMKDALGELVNPMAVYASITSAMTMYLLLWTLPEPVSKGVAATLTVALIAYLGVDTVWRLIDGWLTLVQEVDRASTFEQIEAAGETYGKTMGRTAAKAFVLLVTVAVGNTAAGMGSMLPALPGAGQAAVMAEAQLGIRYAAASQVEAITVSAEGATLTLAPGAVAMAAQERNGGGTALGYRSFKSFESFKRAVGPAGFKKQWHHIVEQTEGNVERFGPEAIHNTENVIPLEEPIHKEVSRLYSQIRSDITGSETLTLRKWLSAQSLEEQRQFGLRAIENVRKGTWP